MTRHELTVLHLRVLAYLIQHPQIQGGELLAEVPGLKSGTLYPMLRQLAERGLVLAQVQAFESGRTTYEITATGQRAFTEAANSLIKALAPALEFQQPAPVQVVSDDLDLDPSERVIPLF